MQFLKITFRTCFILFLTVTISSCSKKDKEKNYHKDSLKVGYILKKDTDIISSEDLLIRSVSKYSKENKLNLIQAFPYTNKEVLAELEKLYRTNALGLIISVPDPRLGPAIISRANRYKLKTIAIDNRFLDSNSTYMNVPYIGTSAKQISETILKIIIKNIEIKKWDKQNTAVLLIKPENDTYKNNTMELLERLLINYGILKNNIIYQNTGVYTNKNNFSLQIKSILNQYNGKNFIIYGFESSQVNIALNTLEEYLNNNFLGFGFSYSIDFDNNLNKNYIGNIYLSPVMYAKIIMRSISEWIELNKKPKLVQYIDVVFVEKN